MHAVNIGGTYRDVLNIRPMVDGERTLAREVWVNVDGVWQESDYTPKDINIPTWGYDGFVRWFYGDYWFDSPRQKLDDTQEYCYQVGVSIKFSDVGSVNMLNQEYEVWTSHLDSTNPSDYTNSGIVIVPTQWGVTTSLPKEELPSVRGIKSATFRPKVKFWGGEFSYFVGFFIEKVWKNL